MKEIMLTYQIHWIWVETCYIPILKFDRTPNLEHEYRRSTYTSFLYFEIQINQHFQITISRKKSLFHRYCRKWTRLLLFTGYFFLAMAAARLAILLGAPAFLAIWAAKVNSACFFWTAA